MIQCDIDGGLECMVHQRVTRSIDRQLFETFFWQLTGGTVVQYPDEFAILGLDHSSRKLLSIHNDFLVRIKNSTLNTVCCVQYSYFHNLSLCFASDKKDAIFSIVQYRKRHRYTVGWRLMETGKVKQTTFIMDNQPWANRRCRQSICCFPVDS